MSRRARISSFGSAAFLFAAGVVIAAASSGTAGQVVGFVLIGLGLVLATSLVFLEVGLSEDRERAQRATESESSERKPPAAQTRPRFRARLGRGRGERRNLS